MFAVEMFLRYNAEAVKSESFSYVIDYVVPRLLNVVPGTSLAQRLGMKIVKLGTVITTVSTACFLVARVCSTATSRRRNIEHKFLYRDEDI